MKLTQRGLLRWMILLLSMMIVGLYFFGPGAYQPQLPGGSPAIQARPEGGFFQLQSADGPVDTRRFDGKVMAVYFGYTQCPDICPTSLAALTMALDALTPEELAQVQPLFVSVDPDRDTVERLATYSQYFHKAILGLTGSKAAVDQVVAQYGAAYRMVESDSAMGYLVDHSSMIYVTDRHGKLAVPVPHGAPPAELAAAIREQLALN